MAAIPKTVFVYLENFSIADVIRSVFLNEMKDSFFAANLNNQSTTVLKKLLIKKIVDKKNSSKARYTIRVFE